MDGVEIEIISKNISKSTPIVIDQKIYIFFINKIIGFYAYFSTWISIRTMENLWNKFFAHIDFIWISRNFLQGFLGPLLNHNNWNPDGLWKNLSQLMNGFESKSWPREVFNVTWSSPYSLVTNINTKPHNNHMEFAHT